MEREVLGECPTQPFLARCGFDEASHRPASFGHHIRERRIADIEIPQRSASQSARRPLAMGGEPGDQLTRLRPLEDRRAPLLVDDVNGPEEPDQQRPVQQRPVGGCLDVRSVIRVVGAIVNQVEPRRGMLDELGDGGQLVAIETERNNVDPHWFEAPGRRPVDQRVARRIEGSGDDDGEPRYSTRRAMSPRPRSRSRTPRARSPVPTPRHLPSASAARTSTPSPALCSRGVTWRGRTRRRTSRTQRGGDDRRTSPDPTRRPPVAQPRRAPRCRVWR